LASVHDELVHTHAHSHGRTHDAHRLAIALALLGAGAWQIFGDHGPDPAPDLPPEPLAHPPRPPALPAAATVRVTSEPPLLDLRVDGRAHGTTPAILSLAADVPHEITVMRGPATVAFTTVVLRPAEDREVVLREPPAAEAHVRVITTPPGASVRIDGVEVGITPVELTAAPGEHQLALALTGYVAESTVTTLGAERSTLSFALRPEPVAVPDTPAHAGGRPPRGHDHDHDRDPAPRTGTLTINTTPWSEVYLGSRRLGTTPLANVRLPAGTHTLTLRAANRPPVRHTVTIEADQEARVRVTL